MAVGAEAAEAAGTAGGGAERDNGADGTINVFAMTGAESPSDGDRAQDPAGGNWRMERDAAALARQKLQAAEETDGEEAVQPSPDDGKALSWKERLQKEREEKERQKREAQEEKARQRREEQEAKERQKREAQEAKEREKREAQEEKARQKREAEEERQRKRHEKKEARAVVRQERRQEWKSLWHMVEFAMLVTFIVLAIDQAGLYGFLFVWLFAAVMIASVALLLLGIVRAIRKKRCGIIFVVAVLGIIACTAWFIFLVSEQGLGLGPIAG